MVPFLTDSLSIQWRGMGGNISIKTCNSSNTWTHSERDVAQR